MGIGVQLPQTENSSNKNTETSSETEGKELKNIWARWSERSRQIGERCCWVDRDSASASGPCSHLFSYLNPLSSQSAQALSELQSPDYGHLLWETVPNHSISPSSSSPPSEFYQPGDSLPLPWTSSKAVISGYCSIAYTWSFLLSRMVTPGSRMGSSFGIAYTVLHIKEGSDTLKEEMNKVFNHVIG